MNEPKAFPTGLSAQAEWFRERAIAIIRRYAQVRRWIQIVFVLGGAFISGTAGTLAKLWGPPHDSWLYAVAILGAVVVFLTSATFLFVDEKTMEAVSRALEAIDAAAIREDEIQELAVDFRWIARLYATARALREYLESLLADGEALRRDIDVHLTRLLDLVIAEKHVLFDIGDEQWNFAIYVYEPERDILVCKVCRRPLRDEENGLHREWRPGEGHTGMAWQRREELVASDANDPQVEPLFRAKGEKFREEDPIRYRSLASIPIAVADANPLGVLVATSDKIGRFMPDAPRNDPVEPLRLLASALATMMHAARLHS